MLSRELLIALALSVLPVSEVRGSIIALAAYAWGDNSAILLGTLLSTLGNMLVPFIAFGLLDALDRVMRMNWVPSGVRDIYDRILAYGRKRAEKINRNKTYIALALFVGVPLPATGAWTGTLIAYVLGLNRSKSIIAIDCGVVMAAILVSIAVYGGATFLRAFFFL